MNQLKDAKKTYEEILIPAELPDRVNAAVKNFEDRNKMVKLKKRQAVMRKTVGTAAAAAAVFTVLLNTSPAFAQSVGDIPVIGAVARVLTFRSYETDYGDLKLSVEIPSVEMISRDTNGLADSINQEIYGMCEQYANEAVERAEEYKKAFMDTGGTEAEWEAHNIEIRVWYEINSQTVNYLSFTVMGSENWSSAYNETRYYNIDLNSGKNVTLKDLLGENYIRKVNESITEQMIIKSQETGVEFFSPEEGGFAGISDDVHFYINESENPVIVFGKYEIAPGSAGTVEFEIEK